MQIHQFLVADDTRFDTALRELAAFEPHWLLCFGSRQWLRREDLHARLRAACGGAVLSGCSAAGVVADAVVHDRSFAITAVRFDEGRAAAVSTPLPEMGDSEAAGRRLGEALPREGLRHVLLFGPGHEVNGSALIDGMRAMLPEGVTVSGGLAGTQRGPATTFTLGPDGVSANGAMAVGLYGERLHTGDAACGGWESFGAIRRVTRADRNVLYELDGEPALDIYIRYLGPYARDLPTSGLLFPLALMRDERDETGLIRSLIGIDQRHGSLTMAGDIPQGGLVRLMHTRPDELVAAAGRAAAAARPTALRGVPSGQSLALVVSCVGRRLVMGDRVDEEVVAVAEALGGAAVTGGFYSNGEIAHSTMHGAAQLHNQTMTVTWIAEAAHRSGADA